MKVRNIYMYAFFIVIILIINLFNVYTLSNIFSCISLVLSVLFFIGLLSSCTIDCECVFYDETGEVVPSYSTVFEEVDVAQCSELSTISTPGERAGYICP